MNAEKSQNDNTFLRAIQYVVGPEVPWPYRMLLLSTIALLIAGGKVESHALNFQLIDTRPALSGPATSISRMTRRMPRRYSITEKNNMIG